MGRTEIEREYAVRVTGQAEKRGLAETEGAAIAPDQAQAERHERPGEEVDRIADGIAIGQQRVSDRGEQHHHGGTPEQRTAAERLRPLEQPDELWTCHGGDALSTSLTQDEARDAFRQNAND